MYHNRNKLLFNAHIVQSVWSYIWQQRRRVIPLIKAFFYCIISRL